MCWDTETSGLNLVNGMNLPWNISFVLAKYFEIKEGSVPTMLTVIEVPLFNTDTEIVAMKQYIFPRTKMNASVTVKGQTEKTKNTDETSIDILKDPSVNYLGRVIYLDV